VIYKPVEELISIGFKERDVEGGAEQFFVRSALAFARVNASGFVFNMLASNSILPSEFTVLESNAGKSNTFFITVLNFVLTDK
jgi:hypothetical protein